GGSSARSSSRWRRWRARCTRRGAPRGWSRPRRCVSTSRVERMSETRTGPAFEDAATVTAARPLIRVRGVTRVYDQEGVPVHALRGVDLDVEEGEFTSLAGPSGCGKTTLLNIIGALDRPTAGTVEVAGQDLAELSRGEAAAFRLDNVGFIFQAYNLVPV